MRPVRLEIEGFSTFRDRITVDFSGIDVVALVGPTGAGKSTIIDAITFALYGSVARYDDRGVVAPVINQLSAEAKVRLDFEAGGATYTAIRIVRRTKTGASTKEARLERGDEVLAGDARGVDKAVHELLGLDFERFNKTVVLPQGKFATFLHDKPADRQQLLRELLAMGVYEQMGRIARQRAAVAENQLSVLEPQLETDEDLSDERLEQLRADHVRAGEVRAALAKMSDSIDQLTQAQSVASDTLAAMVERQRLLAAATVPANIGALAEELNVRQVAWAEAVAVLEVARANRKEADDALRNGPSAPRCEALLQQHEQLDEVAAQLVTLADQRSRAQSAHEIAVLAATTARDQIAAARETLDRVRAHHDGLAAQLAPLPQPGALQAMIVDYERRDTAQAALHEARANREASTAALTTAQTDALQADRDHRRAVDLAPAAALAGGLTVGEPCPVCAQTVHDLPEVRHDGHDSVAIAERAAVAARAMVNNLVNTQAKASATLESAQRDLDALDLRLARAAPAEQIVEQLAALAELGEAVATAQAATLSAEAERREAEQSPQFQRVLDQVAAAATAVARLDATHDAVAQQRDRLVAVLEASPTKEVLARDLAKAYRLADQASLAAGAETKAEKVAAEATAAHDEIRQQEQRARSLYAQTREALVALAPPNPTNDLGDDWNALAMWAAEATEQAVEAERQARHNNHDLTSELDGLIAKATTLTSEFVPSQGLSITQLREHMASAEQRLSSDIQRFGERREHFDRLGQQASALREHRQVSNSLGQLLRSDGFEKWLLQEVLADLVARATVRLLELSGGQFSLVSSDGSFQICDHRNADEVRDARTLSGGETFLASLSLALALADASADLAAEGSAPLESIFLDEGFGTLDPETLDVVASTLEELGASGRMVGVVTHIRELAERMPVRLEVAKGPTSSTVTRVEV